MNALSEHERRGFGTQESGKLKSYSSTGMLRFFTCSTSENVILHQIRYTKTVQSFTIPQPPLCAEGILKPASHHFQAGF
jgi:hypothetical protein